MKTQVSAFNLKCDYPMCAVEAVIVGKQDAGNWISVYNRGETCDDKYDIAIEGITSDYRSNITLNRKTFCCKTHFILYLMGRLDITIEDLK